MAAPKIRELAQAIETEDGDRIIPGTRRPDGTVRKERRVRPGYTPQDEQPVYQSKAALSRQNVPICPGLDPAMLAASSSQSKSSSAKKNEKRSEKKAAGGGDGEAAPATPGSGSAAAPVVPMVTEKIAKLSTGTSKSAPAPPPPIPIAPAPPAQPEDPKAAGEKALKVLRKKIRQAEGLVDKQKTGAALSAEETDKASKLTSWLQEAEDLERHIASL